MKKYCTPTMSLIVLEKDILDQSLNDLPFGSEENFNTDNMTYDGFIK